MFCNVKYINTGFMPMSERSVLSLHSSASKEVPTTCTKARCTVSRSCSAEYMQRALLLLTSGSPTTPVLPNTSLESPPRRPAVLPPGPRGRRLPSLSLRLLLPSGNDSTTVSVRSCWTRQRNPISLSHVIDDRTQEHARAPAVRHMYYVTLV